MNVKQILGKFRGLSVLVVGDICLDRWCIYDPAHSEPSRETGLPRIAVTDVERTPGAGGTVANNLIALGAGRVAVLGAIGEDGSGHILLRELIARGVEPDLVVRSPELLTFTYSKFINCATGIEDLPRVDLINTRPLPASVQLEMAQRTRQFGGGFDVIVVADQAETDEGGIVSAPVRDAICAFAGDRTIWVDSRRRIERFRGVPLKPNEDEAAAACARIGAPGNYRALREHTQAPFLIVTRGGDGAVVVDSQSERMVPGRNIQNPVDICGAGDSFTAGAAMTLAITKDPVQAAIFGNLVASITVMKKGTGTASPQEVLAAAQ